MALIHWRCQGKDLNYQIARYLILLTLLYFPVFYIKIQPGIMFFFTAILKTNLSEKCDGMQMASAKSSHFLFQSISFNNAAFESHV